MKSWYFIKNKGESCDISIHDEIGAWGITAKDFIKDLSEVKANAITLTINSNGGEVFDGLAMYNAIKNHAAIINGVVMGIAASAASFIACACDSLDMPENSFMMIHQASGRVYGNSDDMIKYGELLAQIDDSVINIYHKKTGIDQDELAEMLNEETWLTAEQAQEFGFCDTVSNKIQIANKLSMSRKFKDFPLDMKPVIDIGNISNKKEFNEYLRESVGMSKEQAKTLTCCAEKLGESQDDAAHKSILKALNSVKIPEKLIK